MATHLAHNQEIEGSNPSPATKLCWFYCKQEAGS